MEQNSWTVAYYSSCICLHYLRTKNQYAVWHDANPYSIALPSVSMNIMIPIESCVFRNWASADSAKKSIHLTMLSIIHHITIFTDSHLVDFTIFSCLLFLVSCHYSCFCHHSYHHSCFLFVLLMFVCLFFLKQQTRT